MDVDLDQRGRLSRRVGSFFDARPVQLYQPDDPCLGGLGVGQKQIEQDRRACCGSMVLNRHILFLEAFGAASMAAEHLVSAAQVEPVRPQAEEKRSDLTLLYRLKGSAPPAATTVFQETLAAPLSPGQEWHWAIVEAKGLPPH